VTPFLTFQSIQNTLKGLLQNTIKALPITEVQDLYFQKEEKLKSYSKKDLRKKIKERLQSI
jgi:hypothetical protein